MRFAWLRTKESRDAPPATSGERLTHIAYNVVWWVPVVMPILGVISYRVGFVAVCRERNTRSFQGLPDL